VGRARAVIICAVCCLLTTLLGLSAATAAGMGPIQVTKATDLRLPASAIPSGFTAHRARENGITSARLGSLYGAKIRKVLDQNGFTLGYHGWLDGSNTPDAPFVTYDMYAFGSSRGAQAGLDTIVGVVQGLETTSLGSTLPPNARTWTDGTETFGSTNQPFSVSQVLFHQSNVLVNVVAYNTGNSSDSISEALKNASIVAAACEAFVKAKMPAGATVRGVPVGATGFPIKTGVAQASGGGRL
jgi:hypothetical protein